MRRRAFLAATATAATAGCLSRAAGGDYDVGMSTSDFRPARIEISRGDTVVWKNTSASAHTVTAYGDPIPPGADYFASGGFQSQAAAEEAWLDMAGAIDPGDTYEHTFETTGTFHYFCIPHEAAGMKGVVVVE